MEVEQEMRELGLGKNVTLDASKRTDEERPHLWIALDQFPRDGEAWI